MFRLPVPNRITFSSRVFLGGIALVVSAFLFGIQRPSDVEAGEASEGNLLKELKIFTDVLAIVERDYVKEVSGRKLVEGAIKGMLTTLDPHSGYMDPDFYQDLRVETKGEFGGLGIEITIKDGLLVVVSPMEGSPAERAGIRSGDAIVRIDGTFTKEYSLIDAVKKLRGPKGSPITISIARKGLTELIDVTLVRDNIMLKSVRSRYFGDGFGYVRINQFMEHTSDDLKSALKRLTKDGGSDSLRGLIIDLRNNPGGLLAQAVAVSDLFLEEGVIVYTDGRVESQKQKFFAHERGTEPEYPIVVIVNGGSASASEIVAGSLKDHGRALVLGTQTFGKGSVQTILPLDNGGALRLTTALYYTKSGRTIQAEGVLPDIVLDAPEHLDSLKGDRQEIPEMRERDLPGAINAPKENAPGKKGRTKSAPGGAKQKDASETENEGINPEKDDLTVWFSKDPQVERALELLKTFNIFKGPKLQTAHNAE